MQLPLYVLIVACLSLVSCASVPGVPFSVEGAPPGHIVMIDTNGRLVDPTGDSDCLSRKDPAGWKTVLDRELESAGFDPRERWSWTPCVGRFHGLSHITLSDPEAYLDDVIDEIHRHFKGKGQTRKVAIIVHGGLADNKENLKTARDLAAQMRNDPNAPYPIFINWQSNLYANLWAHLVRVRQGESKGFKHWFIAFPYLLGDLAKGIGRAPATWFYHYSNDVDRLRARFTNEQKPADATYCALRAEYDSCLETKQDCQVFPISKGPFKHRYAEGAKSSAKNSLTNLVPIRFYAPLIGQAAGNRVYGWLPVKLLVAPLLDGLGTSAWDTMNRHVKVGFHNDGVDGVEPDINELASTRRVWQPQEGYGGIARFMRRLEKEINETSCKPGQREAGGNCLTWQLDLIGHSMGAIMANEILKEFPDAPVFDNIVYLAAASSVRDYEQSVLPYLEDHGDTKMYHLMLHDFAEIREESFFGIPPSGSLLVWIDNFLSKPATNRDKTAGRYVNLLPALPATPRELRDRIHVKAFGVGRVLRSSDPQEHGEFNNFIGTLPPEDKAKTPVTRKEGLKFWEETFWKPDVDEKESDKDPCREPAG